MKFLVSASGLVTGTKRAFTRQFRRLLLDRYPNLFHFVGNPLRDIPHPLMRVQRTLENPAAEHALLWDKLHEILDEVREAEQAGKPSFAQAFGLDAHTRVIALCNDTNVKRMLRERQNENVRHRIVDRGIAAPLYVLLRPPEETGVVINDMLCAHPELVLFPRDVLQAFADRQLAAIEEYFEHIGGQHEPVWIENRGNIAAMACHAADVVAGRAGLNLTLQ